MIGQSHVQGTGIGMNVVGACIQEWVQSVVRSHGVSDPRWLGRTRGVILEQFSKNDIVWSTEVVDA